MYQPRDKPRNLKKKKKARKMNALYNHANKQKQLLVKDLAKLEDILQNESEIATRSNIILSTQGIGRAHV